MNRMNRRARRRARVPVLRVGAYDRRTDTFTAAHLSRPPLAEMTTGQMVAELVGDGVARRAPLGKAALWRQQAAVRLIAAERRHGAQTISDAMEDVWADLNGEVVALCGRPMP